MDSQQQQRKPQITPALTWTAGVLFTFFIALLGFLLAKVPGFSHIGQLASAIFIAVLYRQFFGYPEVIRNGITFSSKKLLRLAIILYGLKLNIDVVFRDGLGLLVRDTIIIAFAILFIIWLAKLLKADRSISLLLGVGTGVCGAAAIAAIAPIIKAKDEDTAISVGVIALMGTVFSIIYTIIRPILPLDVIDYGIWSGMSLHELAHVAIAAEPAGNDALAIALLTKLGRVFLLVPLSFIFIYMMKRKNEDAKQRKTKAPFPYFLLGFILLSILGSYVFGHSIPVSGEILQTINNITTWLLTAAMVGLGLNVSLKDVRTRALKPLMAMIVTSILVSFIAYVLI
ncbi:YeiH family protein [Pseudogracilibacillus sp. SO30301A]|uniref:YeiH family protein n=1 Tax=Pseudogracilibacillus sp. SO30301A TaxID=3098291 RepID=UPI00300DEFA2